LGNTGLNNRPTLPNPNDKIIFQNFDYIGRYEAYIGSFLPTFWDTL